MKTTNALLLPISLLVACSSTVDDTAKTMTTVPTNLSKTYVDQMRDSLNANAEMSVINELETIAVGIESTLLRSWASAWKSQNAGYLGSSSQSSFSGLQWASPSQSEVRTFDGITEYSLSFSSGSDQSQEYLSQYSHIHDFQLDLVKVNQSGSNVIASVRFDLRGQLSSGERRHDRGLLSLTLNKESGSYKIIDISSNSFQRLLSSRAPSFEDATEALGLKQLPIDDRKEAIRRGGYALVVADYDKDGRSDMLVGNYGPLKLLKNTPEGFVDVTASSGLSDEGVVKSAAFADLDNDGDRDLALLRFVVGNKDGRGDFIAYENNGDGTFTLRKNVLPKHRSYDRAMPMTLGDFDSDGNIDIYIGFPGIRDFTSGISNRTRPEYLASQGIWFNKGAWNFNEAQDASAVVAANHVYAHAAVASDIDADGNIDLLVVDDSGRINPVYKNNGDGTFVESSQEMQLKAGGLSMGLTTGDYDNDGDIDIMSTNIVLNAGQRMAASTDGLLDSGSKMGKVMQRLRDDYKGLVLYQNNGDGSFTDVTEQAGIKWEGQAAAAGEWVDYNHDGLLDYYLPNGLWTGGDESFDSLFFRSEIAAYGDSIIGAPVSELNSSDPMPNDIHGRTNYESKESVTENPEVSPNPILTVLRNHKENENSPLTYSIAGSQRNTLFRNNGDGTFTEVGYLENADRIEDGYIVAPVDIDNDGTTDLVMRNTDPAPENSYPSVVALRNTRSADKAVTLKFASVNGNIDAIGLVAIAEINGVTQTRELRAVNGAVQAEPALTFGLKSGQTIDKLTIKWPGKNAKATTLTNVQPGLHIINEDKAQ